MPSRLPLISRELKKKKIEELKQNIEKEKNVHFFECSEKCVRMSFENAMDLEFKCPECGDLMHQQDNLKKIEEMGKEIEKLEKEIIEIPEIIYEDFEDDENSEEETSKKITIKKEIKKKIKTNKIIKKSKIKKKK